MPQQSLNPGPFTEYLTKSRVPDAPPITGFEGPLGAIAQIGTSFLKGVSNARRQNFEMKEQQRLRNMDALGQMMQFADQAGLTPAAASQFKSGVMQQLVGQVAAADQGGGSKQQGGNPLFGLVKGLAQNLVGPNAPKTKEIGEQEIGAMFSQLQGMPTLQKVQTEANAAMSQGFKEVSEAVKARGGMHPTPTELLANPQFQGGVNMLVQQGIVQEPMAAVSMYLKATGNDDPRRLWLMNYMNKARQRQNADAAQPPATVQPQQEVVSQTSGIPPYLKGAVEIDPEDVMAAGFDDIGTVGKPDDYAITDERGRALHKFTGSAFQNRLMGQQGVLVDYNGKKYLVPNAQQAGNVPMSNMPPTPEEVESMRNASNSLIDGAKGLDRDDREYARRIFESHIATSDWKAAPTKVEQHIRWALDNKTQQANRDASRVEGMTPSQVSQFNGIVDKYNKSPLIAASDRLGVLKNAIEQARQNPNNGAIQMNLAYATIQAFDTYQSAVREGELRMVNSIDSIFGKVKNTAERMQNGQIFRPEVALELTKIADTLVGTINRGAQAKARAFEAQASANGPSVGAAWNRFTSGFTPAYTEPSAPPGAPNPSFTPRPSAGGSPTPPVQKRGFK